MNTISFLGFDVLNGQFPNIFDRDRTVCINTINPHSYVLSKTDVEFLKALQTSDILVPDGSGIIIGCKIIHGVKVKKFAGYDVFLNLMAVMEDNCGKVFFMGSTDYVLKNIKRKVESDYPSIQCEAYSPPFKSKLSDRDNKNIIAAINAFKPDVLFVGMTAPKQEKWVLENKIFLETNVIATIGAVFDFYAGTVKRPSRFWIDLGLEWLPRLIGEPKRLWKRMFISAPVFLFDVFSEKFFKSSK